MRIFILEDNLNDTRHQQEYSLVNFGYDIHKCTTSPTTPVDVRTYGEDTKK